MASEQALAWSKPLFIGGIGLSAASSSMISSLSLVSIPTALTHTTNAGLLKAWRSTLFVGGSICIPLTMTAGITHAINAYLSLGASADNVRSKILAAAALCNFAIVPYTMLLILPVNATLMQAQEASEKAASKDPEPGNLELVHKWARFNAIRSCLPALGAVVAYMALN